MEGWIKKIVINTSLDFIRSNKTYRNKFILTAEFPSYDSSEKTDDVSFSDAEMYLSGEEMFELISALPPATRIVFNLYVVDDFKHKQIAKQLNISTGTSQWHLSNARKLLREKINEAITKKNSSNNVIHG